MDKILSIFSYLDICETINGRRLFGKSKNKLKPIQADVGVLLEWSVRFT